MMMRQVCTGKLHRVKVTRAELAYAGSITLGRELMTAAGIHPFQLVHINNLSNAAHWETYAIPGEEGEVGLNGPPARLFVPGDLVVVNAFELIMVGTPAHHRVVQVDHERRPNAIVRVDEQLIVGWPE